MHEWKSNCVSNQFGGIFSAIMSRYSEERVRVHRFFRQNQLGELKTSFITWHMWCMWCTQLCIDQFLSLHSLVFQPHDILGHMICVCSIKIYSSRILPKKLIQVKMPQTDSLDSDLQTFCNFSTTESSLSSQTLVQWGVSCYSSVEQVHLIDALWGRRCLGRMACFGTLFWGLGQALLIWDLCKIATWPSKERQKLKKKKCCTWRCKWPSCHWHLKKGEKCLQRPKKSRRIVTTCTCCWTTLTNLED